ncbi:MAG TPA: endonuclease III [Gemmatimonadaceae bacterium]|nr:endonuclease III [Gemmatimonadaceae bacterium]
MPARKPVKSAKRAKRAAKAAVHKATRRKAPTREYAATIYDRLVAHYPDAHCALDFKTPFQLLIATILSAQCTDKRVNMVTPTLFEKYPTPRALAEANPEELEAMIKSTGFFRNKAKSLIGMAAGIVERHGGRVPKDMDALVHLPGVGRKTANVVLGNAFDTNEGVVVDTHVSRVTQRLGLTRNDDPVKIEQDLIALFPREQWTLLSHLLIEHGRTICEARKPKCEVCFLNDLCPSSRV